MAVERCMAKKKFMDFLLRKKLRVTAQRRAIIDSALETVPVSCRCHAGVSPYY